MENPIFFPEVDNYNSIIIFGCGKNGRVLFKYLKKTNRGDKVCCFADNNESNYAKKYKSKKIVRPESAKELYKSAMWIIPSPQYSVQMRQQLQEMEISEEDILQVTSDEILYIQRYVYRCWYKEDKYFMYDLGFRINLRFIIAQIRNVFYGRYYESIIKKDDCIREADLQYKYNVSICSIFLNEAPYMREWIEFHKMVGVEHFYLYNNMSTDEYESILNSYVEDGIVTLIDWNIPHGQISAYWDCIRRFSGETRWIGFIDLDEFVVPRENKIYDFLRQYDNKCGSILIFWRTFGSSGKISRDLSGLVTEDFKKCWPKLEDVGKCFYNTGYQISSEDKNGLAMFHICFTRINDRDLPPMNVYGKVSVPNGVQRAAKGPVPIQINHYTTKSYEEYQKKRIRPDAVFETNPRTNAMFHYYDGKAVATDNVIEQYLPELRRKLGRENSDD